MLFSVNLLLLLLFFVCCFIEWKCINCHSCAELCFDSKHIGLVSFKPCSTIVRRVLLGITTLIKLVGSTTIH